MAISKSAGNQFGGEDEAACPYTLNSTCVGATNLGGSAMTCYSSWTNNNGPKNQRTDREEPDLAVFGGTSTCEGGAGVEVLKCDGRGSCGGTSDWDSGDGTSFAAPQVAGMTALCKETAGGSVDALTMRAMLKAASWGRNVADFNYSASSSIFTSTNDWHDGGGKLIADPLRFACGGGGGLDGGHVKSGHDDGDLSHPSEWPFGKEGDCASCNHNDPPLGGKSLHPASDTPPGPGDGRSPQLYFDVDLKPGDRLRTVLVWNSCPTDKTGIATAPVATDIDVFLVKDKRIVYSSQSVSDVTEGLDVTIPEDLGAGHYELYWTYPIGSKGCADSGFEPFSWSTWWWTR
jgi:hypothetical protein